MLDAHNKLSKYKVRGTRERQREQHHTRYRTNKHDTIHVDTLVTAATAAKLRETLSKAVSQAAVAAKHRTVQSFTPLTTL